MINEFMNVFNNVSKGLNNSKVYEEWLDYCIDINLFQSEDRGLDFQGRESEYFKLFTLWINIVHDYNVPVKPDYITDNFYSASGDDWFDFLGYYYQNHIQSQGTKQNSGSFYTPANVCTNMAEMTILEGKEYSGSRIKDPCCGSGRLLLAGHSLAPTAFFVACDLDLTATKLATLNFWIHGVKGVVLNMDSLSGTFYNGWKVNNLLGASFPLPHIELINSEEEALQFIGENDKDNEVDIEDGKVVEFKGSDGSVQSTLI